MAGYARGQLLAHLRPILSYATVVHDDNKLQRKSRKTFQIFQSIQEIKADRDTLNALPPDY